MRPATLLLIPLLLGLGPATAQSAPGSVRRDVAQALKEREASEQANALYRALGEQDGAEAVDAVLDLALTEDRSSIVWDVGIGALARMESGEALAELRQAAGRGSLTTRTAALEALGRSAAPGAAAALLVLAGDPDPRVRAAALTSLGERAEESSRSTLEAALADPRFEVRSAAVWALGRLRGESSVPALCAALRREGGRLVDDLADTLGEVTGQRRGPRPEAYERRDAGGATAEPAEPFEAPPQAFDSSVVTTRSRRILFVLQTSETMREPAPGAARSAEAIAAVARAGDDLAEDLRAAESKLDVARVHLRAMLRTLRDDVRFDVATYAASPSFAFGELVQADADARRRAEARIARLSPSGPANLHGAVVRVFAPRGKDPLSADGGPDTVVLFSDGALSEPGSTDVREVAGPAQRWNRVRQVRFLCVGVGQADGGNLGRLTSGPPGGRYASVP